MNPTRVTVSLAAADADGISLSQTPAGAGNLTITGALATGGVATLTGANIARQVIITSAADETAKTFTIYGTDASGNTFSEAIAGANAGVAATIAHFRTVTRVAVSAATAGAVTVGTNGVGSSLMINLDYDTSPTEIGIGCMVTGTVNYTVQHMFDNIYSSSSYAPAGYTWFANSDLTAKTASAEGAMTIPAVAVRLLLNSGSGSVALTVIQASPSP